MTTPISISRDGPLWHLFLSTATFPALSAAVDANIFEALSQSPATPHELAERLRVNPRATRALLPLFSSIDFLVQRNGRYHLTETARMFLLRASPYFWGPVFSLARLIPISYDAVTAQLNAPESASSWEMTRPDDPTNAWSEGTIALDVAQGIAAFMHATSSPAAHVLAQRLDLSKTKRLLDVGAGSGCYSIALAKANPHLHCTLMELKTMGEIALTYVRSAGVADRVNAAAVDMFRQEWVRGHDAIFFSNIFHDWNFDTCAQLARKAYEALEPGGTILIHEMLLDDTHDGPPTATAFSVYMLLSTKGQQFTGGELTRLLVDAGFIDIQIFPAHEHFGVVSGRKPA